MTNSHEVINLETMAQCLADARILLRDGVMCPDTYVSLLEEASRLIRSVLAFAQDAGLEIEDGEEQEAWAIVDRYQTVLSHRCSLVFQGGDYDLYHDLQDPWDLLVMEPQPGDGDGALASSFPNLYRLRFYDAEMTKVSNYQNHCRHCHDDPTERASRLDLLESWVHSKGTA